MEDKEIFDRLNKKVETKVFWIIIPVIFTALVNLYIVYFSGFVEIKTSVATLIEKTNNIETDIAEIKDIFNQYDIEVE